MSRLSLGSICGVVFGMAVVVMMLPMEFPDKTAALAGAFLDRFGIGFVIGAAKLPLPGWLTGLIFGLLLSQLGTERYVRSILNLDRRVSAINDSKTSIAVFAYMALGERKVLCEELHAREYATERNRRR